MIDTEKILPTEQDFADIAKKKHRYESNPTNSNLLDDPEIMPQFLNKNSVIKFYFVAKGLGWTNLSNKLLSIIKEKLDESDISEIKETLKTNGKEFTELCRQYSLKPLTEDIEKHETLNPLLWNSDNTLKPEVEEKINLIVDEFVDGLADDEVKIEIKDIKLVGSNCSYNYTKDSDLDIHIECDTEKLDCPDNLYPKLYSAYRSIFNNKLDIDFYGIPVELYVETEESTVNSNGIYSVMAQKWLKEPVVESIPEIDQDALNAAFEPWEERYNDIMNRAETEGISAVKDLQEDFEKPKSIIADQIRGEWDAIKNYHAAADDLSNIDGSFDNVIDTLNSIADEEEVHVGELTSALSEIDDNVENNIEDGQKEYADDNSGEQELTEAVSTPLIDDIDKLIEDIYEQRKTGIAEGGEYDNRNLLFKEFRNKGYLDNLRTLKNKLISNELSLKETIETMSQVNQILSGDAMQDIIDGLEGDNFQIELYEAKNGHNYANEYINNLSQENPKLCGKLLYSISRLKTFGIRTGKPFVEKLEDSDAIFELRAKEGSNISRCLFFYVVGNKAVITNGFTKKSQKTPRNVIEKAEELKSEYFDTEEQ